jgi:hypothetical protein
MIGNSRMIVGGAIAGIVVGIVVGGWSGVFWGFLAMFIWAALCGVSDGLVLRRRHKANTTQE